MCACQIKPGYRVIEKYIGPLALLMTFSAILIRIILCFNIILVYILMTIAANYAYFPEIPVIFLFMALKTRSRKMSACQRKSRGIMLYDGKREKRKAIHIVAF